jgi:Phage integrase family
MLGPVYDKEKALVPLRTLEEVGRATYPLTAARLQRSEHRRALARHLRDPEHVPVPAFLPPLFWLKTGTQVMLPDGNWEVCFRGTELKIASRKTTGVNEYRHPVPADLNALIHEWLTVWRPKRLPAEGSALVFPNQLGRMFCSSGLNCRFIDAVARFTGMRTTIHMVRDSWASEYLDATGDVAGCADMLGDTVQMVLKHYAHVLKRRAQGRTARWLQTHLGVAG